MFPSTDNPFRPSMVRMQLPPGSGPTISAGGYELAADEDGCVEVPKGMVEDLRSHGLRPLTEVEAEHARAKAEADRAQAAADAAAPRTKK